MTGSNTIYLDYAASTPIAPQVLAAMMPFLTTEFGNSSSASHAIGHAARGGVEQARTEIAQLVHANPSEVVFTSGGTESNNLAIKGIMHQHPNAHLVVSAIEHVSVLDSARRLERDGVSVTYVNPNQDGTITVDAVAAAIKPNTKLVSVMWGNNEIGTLNDIEAIASLCKKQGILVHSDAAQALGHLTVDASLVDLLTITGHKVYAPKGVGALIVQPEVTVTPQIVGGDAQRGVRAGTANVASIVGFGKACSLCCSGCTHSIEGVRNLCESLLGEAFEDIQINGHQANRLPHISSVQFASLSPDFSPAMITGVACSAGSACQSGHGATCSKHWGFLKSRLHLPSACHLGGTLPKKT